MKRFIAFFVVIVFVFACKKPTEEIREYRSLEEIDFAEIPYKNLSDYGFYTGELRELISVEGIVPYEPIASLFTDYAYKKREVWMPKGTYATIPDDPDDPIDFPDKTILIKNFYYPQDFNRPEENIRLIETRLLVKDQDEWDAYAYLWNDEQTEAVLKNAGAIVPVSFVNEKGTEMSLNYVVPQRTQCRTCHNRNDEFLPIGPKGKQLNSVFSFAGQRENQLEKWMALGILKSDKNIVDFKPLADPMNKSEPLDLRARSYLDANCAYCHIITGPASTSGLYLNVEEENKLHRGIMKSPVAAGMGGGGFKYDIYPGHGMESIITYRMNSVHPGVMMPEFGRVTIHEEGVKLIAEWIDQMK